MRIRMFVMACVAMLALGPAPAHAQGLGGLLKKGKKALEKVSGSLGGSKGNRQGAAVQRSNGTDVEQPCGGTLRNPIAQIIDVQLIGAYGKSTSENYGTVSLLFKVKMIANKTNIRFGVNSECPGLMIDQDGNTYKTQESAGWYDYSVTWFADVKKTATTIQQLQIGISASYDDTGLIILKNVPIQWDVEQ